MMMLHKQVTSVLNKQKRRDSWFLTDYSVNPFEGCSCNCLYCYIRGSKYGENMENGLAVKINALTVLDRQLKSRAAKRQFGFVAVGSATDAYMRHEEEWRLTRGMLELLLKYRFPVFLSTKSSLILRDTDLLQQIADAAILPGDLRENLGTGLIVSVSVSTMDSNIAGMLEPGALLPADRMKILQQLKQHGFLSGVNAIPILPFISDTDHELEKIIVGAINHQADYVLTGGLTLFGDGPADSKPLFYKFLQRYDPRLIASYQQLYGDRFYPQASYLSSLKNKSDELCKRHGIRSTILKTHVAST